MRFFEIFSSEGCYSRDKYIVTQIVTDLLGVILIWPVTVNLAFLVIVIPGWLALWWVSSVSTVKRLHDLGRPDDDYIKTFIPILGSVIQIRLWYEHGQEEKDIEAARDYQIQEYERRQANRKDVNNKNY